MKGIYLDYAATTPVDPRVVAKMTSYFTDNFGNTMSMHHWGREAAEVLEKSRETVAGVIGAKAGEIYFTGSATESNNLAIKGVAWANREKGKKIAISAIEHDCVEESAEWLKREGWEVNKIGVDKEGRIRMEELLAAVEKGVIMVSVIHGNNEIGVVQDIGRIGSLCRDRGIYFHTDASQSLGKEKIDVEAMKIDLLTASAHKIYGPKGAAVLYIRQGVKIEPWLHGGGHEKGLRSSTVNVAAIAGMAAAVEIYEKEGEAENRRILGLREKLIEGILGGIKGATLNGSRESRLVNNVNISFAGVEGESIMLRLDMEGIAVSTGSACSSKSLEPSRVLLAMGRTPMEAHGSIRFSLGRWTTEEEIDKVLKILPGIIKDLRAVSPFKL